MLDRRLPRDLGMFHQSLPQLHAALAEGRLLPLLHELGQPAGWYNDLLALAAHLLGRSPLVLTAPGLLWVGLVLLSTALAARRLGGPPAGAAAAALVGGMPLVVDLGRLAWIHVPEAALVGLAWLALLADPSLRRGRTLLLAGACGALAITLRPSGAPWVLTLALPWLWRADLRPAPERLLRLLLPWALAFLVPAGHLRTYLVAKALARERYAETLPPLWLQLASWLGTGVAAACLVGVLALLLRRHRDLRLLVPAAWVGGALLLWALFRAGIDNFSLLGPGLAVLAAVGLVRLRPVAAAAPLALLLPMLVLPLVPAERLRALGRIPLLEPFAREGDSRSVLRPWTGLGATELSALIDATCPPPREQHCDVVVDQGLLEPFSESPGQLELFLAGVDMARVIALREPGGRAALDRVDALVQWDCPEGEAAWRARYPRSAETLAGVLQEQGLAPAWTTELRRGCFLMWMSPGGVLAAPALLPPGGILLEPGQAPPQPGDGPGRGRGPRAGSRHDLAPHPGAPLPGGPEAGAPPPLPPELSPPPPDAGPGGP